MKRILIATLVCLMVMGLSSAAFAANVFTLAPSTYDRLYELLEGPLSTNANTLYLTVPSGVGDQSFAPNVGYYPATSDPTNKFAWIRIGVNDTGTATYGLPSGYVGLTGETVAGIGASNLSAYDGYGLSLKNLDNSIWATRLYLKTNTGGEYYTPWNWMAENATNGAYLDFSTVTGEDTIKAIGFEIGSNLKLGAYPSDSDTAHVLVTPVPEPSSMLLLGMGVLGLFGLGRKKKA